MSPKKSLLLGGIQTHEYRGHCGVTAAKKVKQGDVGKAELNWPGGSVGGRVARSKGGWEGTVSGLAAPIPSF